MSILYLLLALIIIWALRQAWPVNSLSYVDVHRVRQGIEIPATVKLVDIRDAVEYQKDNVRGSMNISLGRLPYVWNKGLSPEDSVLILADNPCKSNKAARILHKRGFRNMYSINGDFLLNKTTLSELIAKG
ncbi:rhodanese-like domain-containing protein [Paenibacillus monticola]|nr:rhodanese-like domain-containing protein [Paenibacillus monticola]